MTVNQRYHPAAVILGLVLLTASPLFAQSTGVPAGDGQSTADKSSATPPVSPAAAETKPATIVPLSAEQAKLAGKYKELERVILRMAEVMQETDPKRAALLRQAFAQSKEKQIDSQYEDVVKLLQQEQLYQASKGQVAMQQDLDQLLQLLLSGERDKQIPNERAEIKRFIERINKLIREEQAVQGETEGQGDPQDLIKDQENIANKTADLSKDLNKFNELNNPGSGANDKSGKPDEGKPGEKKSDDKDSDGKKSDDKGSDEKNADNKGDEGAKSGDKSTDKLKDKDGQKSDKNQEGKKGDQPPESQPNSDGQPSGQEQSGSQKSGDQKPGQQKSDSQKSGDQKSDNQKEGQKSDGKDDQKSDGQKPTDKKWEKSDDKKSQKSDEKRDGKSDEKSDKKSDQQDGSQQGSQSKSHQGQQQQGQQNQSPNDNDDNDADKQNKQSDNQQSDSSGRKRIQQAEERMRAAKRQLEQAQRRGAADEEQKAVEELKQAKAELEEILRQLREEEIERVLAQLESRFRKMLQMQIEVYEGTIALDRTEEQDRDRDTEMEAGKLGRKEAEISGEAEKALALLHEEGSSVAFPEAMDQTREDMDHVKARLNQANIGQITQGLEQDIVKSLEEMVAALQKAQKEQQQRRGGGGGGGGSQDQPLVNAIAELKMIRALQMRVNTRTERYSKLLQDGAEQAEAPDLLDAVKRLSEREQRIYQTTHDIVVEKNK